MEDINVRHIIIFISGVAVALAVRMLNRDSEKKDLKFDKDGNIVLKMSKFYDFLGYMSIILGLMIVVMSQFRADSTTESIIIMFIGLFLMLEGIFVIITIKRTRVVAGQAGVRYIKFTGKEKYIPWNEIKEIKFNKF